MAEVVAPDSQDTARLSHPEPHGKKRAADSSLESEQRLSKRFDLLNLVDTNGTRLYIPVPGSSQPAAKQAPPVHVASVTNGKRPKTPRAPAANDCMHVEDTPHRVYIHDLAAELSDIESDEEKPIFISDIERHLAKIPKHVLLGPEPKATKDNQLILYNVPSSLSLPEEQDSVKKAIVEARARVRERQANPVVEPKRRISGSVAATGRIASEIPISTADPDAMDLD